MTVFIFIISTFLYAQDYVEGEVIVKFRQNASKTAISMFKNKAIQNSKMKIKGSWTSLRMQHYKANAGQSTHEIMAELSNDPNVEYVEPNYIVSKVEVPGARGELLSQSEFETLASISQNDGFIQTSANIDAEQGWNNLSITNERPVVAIIDTGIDFTHSAFTRWCAIWVNQGEKNGIPGVDDDGNGYIDDIHGYDFSNNDGSPYDDDGHGTHVAGIAFGATQDITAIPEVSPVGGVCADGYKSRIRLMAVKFLDGNGSGTTSDAIKAIYYAINNGAKVLNNSWGGGSYSQSLHDAIGYSYDQSVSFVAAAGNSSDNNDIYPSFPANYDAPNVISVASTQSNDNLSFFSNYGKNTVHLASPGSSIYSTYPGGFYTNMSGTSMAAPFVAGVAGLIAREQVSITSFQIKEIILDSANPLANLTNITTSGARLNINNSILSAQGAVIDPTQPNYSINYSLFTSRSPASSSGGGGCGMVSKMDHQSYPRGGFGAMGLLALLLLPLVILLILRQKENRRRHERFSLHSSMKIKVGDKELSGSMESLSLGGAGIDVQDLVDQGSILTLKISKPDGSGEVEVKGKVVWSDGTRHGVQFVDCKESLLASFLKKVT